MLHDVVNPQEQLQIGEISSPLSAQILEFCESELFPETLQNSEVASGSNCCYEDYTSYANNLPFNTQEIDKIYSNISNNGGTPKTAANSTTNIPPMTTTNNANNLSIIFVSSKDRENDISASIEFSPSLPFSVPRFLNGQQEQFDLSLLQNQMGMTDCAAVEAVLSQYASEPIVPPLLGPPLPALHEEDCLSTMPYMKMNPLSPNCSSLDPEINSYMPSSLNAALSNENSGIFNGNMFLGTDMQPQELDYQGDNGGIFCTEPLPRVYSSDLQALSSECQHLVNGAANSTPLASEITSMEDSTFKVGKLSVEERKEKIHRYMRKRNQRNFSKKIKYACRKTLADSRPRVRGRFAKNDDFGETTRTTCSTHEEDTDDDVRSTHVVLKEEEDMVDSSDIFAHISGVNSFKCNYSIQSWI